MSSCSLVCLSESEFYVIVFFRMPIRERILCHHVLWHVYQGVNFMPSCPLACLSGSEFYAIVSFSMHIREWIWCHHVLWHVYQGVNFMPSSPLVSLSGGEYFMSFFPSVCLQWVCSVLQYGYQRVNLMKWVVWTEALSRCWQGMNHLISIALHCYVFILHLHTSPLLLLLSGVH